MRILYGVASEGMGHATRAKVVAGYLRARGHAVRVATAGRALELMRRALGPESVVPIEGLGMVRRGDVADHAATVAATAARLPGMLAANAAALRGVDGFAPELALVDYEPFVRAYAAERGLPVVSIDNNQMLARCEHDPALLEGTGVSLARARLLPSLMVPDCDHYVVTTFFYPPLRPHCRPDTTLVPPIVRSEIAAAAAGARGVPPGPDAPVLVYQTVRGDGALRGVLAAQPAHRFVVYGQHPAEVSGNVTFKPFDERGFVSDLIAAKAVVANGGMSLLGEAVYLGKPVYSVPLRAQPEQALNAGYVAALGFGATSPRFDAATLGAFLAGVPGYAAAIRAAVRPDGNRALFGVLDELLGRLGRRRT